MKVILDIRLYKSSSKNKFGSFITESFGSKKLIATIKRIVMKLRENNFSFGEFDHLYINFTTCDIANEIELSDYIDKYHPWYRYCNIKVDVDLYSNLDSDTNSSLLINWVEKALCLFESDEFSINRINDCITEALE